MSTGTETEIDIDPDNSSGDNKSRDHLIQAIWHDRDNSTIWFLDCDNDATADNFDVWKLDYTSSKTSPTVTEVGTSSGADANTVYGYDIFKIGANIYVLNFEQRSGTDYFVVWDVDTAPFTEKDTFDPSATLSAAWHVWYGIVTGSIYYTIFYAPPSGGIYPLIYNNSTTTISKGANFANYTHPGLRGYQGISYDGSDILYVVAYRTLTPITRMLLFYSISGDSWTEHGEFNISLMLDRNTDSTANPPNNLEKGFHITEDKIYQIPPTFNGRLNLISAFDFPSTVDAITDHFVIVNKNVYEYKDLIAHIITGEITHDKEDYPFLDGILRRDKITLTKNLFMQIIGTYSVDQSIVNNTVVFEGKLQNKDGKRIQTFECINQAEEMETVLPSGTKSGRTDELITDITNDTPPAGCEYITMGTLSAGQSITNAIFEGDKNYRSVVNHFKDIDKFTWSLRPQGDLDYNNGTVDSGADLRYNGQSFINRIWNVNTSDLPSGVNRVEVYGAINTTTGTPYSGSWDDEKLQHSENVKLFTITDATLNSNSLCNITAQSIGERESSSVVTVQFAARDTSLGLIQPGQTITFEYLTNDVSVSSAQYIIDRIVVDIKREILYIEASSGLVFEYKRKSPLEEQPFENSQLIRQNARSIQGLQSDLNAIISDDAYNQSTWNAVTTIGASKNALRDKFELIQSDINALQSDVNGFPDNLYSQSEINVFLAIGSGNALWINCAADGGHPKTAFRTQAGIVAENTGGSDFNMQFTVPLPYVIGSKNLYIANTKVGLKDCDGNDYINQYILRCWSDHDSSTDELTRNSNINLTPTTYTYSHSDINIGSYEKVTLLFNVATTTDGEFEFTFCKVEYYYA